MLPGTRTTVLFPVSPVRLASCGVTMSVCSNTVVWSLNFHVILGTGAPTDLQERLPVLPLTTITELLRAVVLASTTSVKD